MTTFRVQLPNDEISNREGAENSDWKGIKCDVCMNKAQESNKFGGVAAETTCFLQSLIFIYILKFVVVVMRFPTEREQKIVIGKGKNAMHA